MVNFMRSIHNLHTPMYRISCLCEVRMYIKQALKCCESATQPSEDYRACLDPPPSKTEALGVG